jgi:hypothetical protein
VGLVRVLPAHSLTRLELGLKSSCPDQCARVAAGLTTALPRLSSLQQLVFRDNLMGKLDSCMSVLGQLSKLTCLELTDMDLDLTATSALQKTLMHPPPLRVLHVSMDGYSIGPGNGFWLPQLDLGCLQQLQEFTCNGALQGLSVLPVQLRHLGLGDCISSQQLAAVMPLQQLTELSFAVSFGEQEPLLRLAQLPALQQLRLKLNSWHDAAAIAPVWGELPQLCELMLYDSDVDNTGQLIAAVVAGIAAATSLTKLEVDFPAKISGQQLWSGC